MGPPILEHLVTHDDDKAGPPALTKRYNNKPRDSGVSMETDKTILLKAPKPKRPAMLKRTSSEGSQPKCVTPGIGPTLESGWPSLGRLDGGQPAQAPKFDFLADAESAKLEHARETREPMDERPVMPDTPVKGKTLPPKKLPQSLSHPSLMPFTMKETVPAYSGGVMASTRKMPASTKRHPHIPHLTLTAESSPESPNGMESSPTVIAKGSRIGGTNGVPPTQTGGLPSRVGMLRRLSSGVGSGEESGDEGTPTKGGGERAQLARESIGVWI